MATFLLMFAFPGFMLGSSTIFPATRAFEIAVVDARQFPGLILSYYTAFTYIPIIRASLREGREDRPLVCGAMTVPAHLLYSSDHEWIAVDGTRARIGITDYAQDALGDVVFVQTPTVGREGDSRRQLQRGREHQIGQRHLRSRVGNGGRRQRDARRRTRVR